MVGSYANFLYKISREISRYKMEQRGEKKKRHGNNDKPTTITITSFLFWVFNWCPETYLLKVN